MPSPPPTPKSWRRTRLLATWRPGALALTISACVACGPGAGEGIGAALSTPGAATLAMVRRCDGGVAGTSEQKGPVKLDWGGAGLEAAFTQAAWVEVQVGTPGGGPASESRGRASLWVDGTGPQDVGAAAPTRREGLDPGRVHHLRLIKRTEPFLGGLEVRAIILAPGGRMLTPPPPPSRRLEIIGDSISSGYGALGRDGTHKDDALEQDSELTYGNLAARAVGAEVRQIAWSGRTLLAEKRLAGAPPPLKPMPELWQPAAQGADAGHLDTSELWRPDAVVVHLGTNDFLRGRPAAHEVGAALEAFVARLRRAYGPQTLLVWAVGPMLGGTARDQHRAAVHTTVEALQARGDRRVRFLDFGDDHDVDLGGVGRHPSAAGHRAMASRLVDAMSAWPLWPEPATLWLCGEAQGLVGGGLELEANFQERLSLPGNGPFCMPTPLAVGQAYDLRLGAAAPGTTCALFGAHGVVGPEGPSAPIEVVCRPAAAEAARIR